MQITPNAAEGKAQENKDVKGKILAAASRLFVEKGYEGTSIRDIAAASDTNVAMVNYYFRSKYNLFELIFGEAFDILVREVFSVLNSDLPFMETVETWIGTYFDVLARYPQIPNFIFTAVHHNSAAMISHAVSYDLVGLFQHISKRIEAEAAKGTIKPIPPLDFALNVISLCVFPFVMRPLAMEIAEKNDVEYEQMLENHKRYVISFVKDAIKA